MRRSIVPALAALVLIATGCSTEETISGGTAPVSPTASEPPEAQETSEAPEPEPEPEVWTDGPTDGTWERNGLGFGQVTTVRDGGWPDEYTLVIRDLPTLVLTGDRQAATMTSTATVERVADHETGDSIAESLRIHFVPGNYGWPQHDEAYGIYPNVECAAEEIPVGESTTCGFSFTAPLEEIQNSYWWSDGRDIAAWPSQT